MAIEALYLHIPFCRTRCAYCDFDTCALAPAAFKREAIRYLAALEGRIDEFGARGALASVRTVYIGGGTPTVLEERLLGLVRRVRAWCAPEEFTCEANPESFHEELAGSLAASGVTRISLGVQSLEDDELSAIGRIHTAAVALEAIELARRAGFSVSCDLMCGLPGQRAASAVRSSGHSRPIPITSRSTRSRSKRGRRLPIASRATPRFFRTRISRPIAWRSRSPCAKGPGLTPTRWRVTRGRGMHAVITSHIGAA